MATASTWDQFGSLIHLGERDGSIMRHSQKIIAEAPSPNLTAPQRTRLCEMGLEIARLFKYRNLGTVEFIMDLDGNFYFAEMKARIQVEHPVTEKVTQVDLVREQIRIAAGEPLAFCQPRQIGPVPPAGRPQCARGYLRLQRL